MAFNCSGASQDSFSNLSVFITVLWKPNAGSMKREGGSFKQLAAVRSSWSTREGAGLLPPGEAFFSKVFI